MTRPPLPKPVVTSISGPNGEPVNVTRCWEAVLRPNTLALTPLKCAKCGSTRHPSYARPGQSCTYGSGCPAELSADNGAMCGGELLAVAQ